MAYDYIQTDLAGYPFNSKYPPDYDKNGGWYHGYRNDTEETLLYDFAVQRYDLRFTYKGIAYHFLSCENYAALCDEFFCNEKQRFVDGNDVLENFLIDGNNILSIIDQLEEVEAV